MAELDPLAVPQGRQENLSLRRGWRMDPWRSVCKCKLGVLLIFNLFLSPFP